MGESDVGEGQLLAFRGDGRTAFRLLKTSRPSEEDWASNYEKGDKPRKAEIESALMHFGLSMWDSPDRARQVNEGFRGRLGNFVGHVELRPELGIWFAETGSVGHLCVWGRPADLQVSFVEVEPV
jgi:hypothetical protein